MVYLKKVTRKSGSFLVEFTNGETTASHETACFYMALQDKDIGADRIIQYIKMGKMFDPGQPWDEIERIARTFIGKKAA